MNFWKIFNPDHLPRWFVALNYYGLIVIIFWPAVFFMSIFFFDNPDNFLLTFLMFIALNSYPVVLIALMLVGFRLYPRYRYAAIAIPVTVLLLELLLFGAIVISLVRGWA